MEHTSPPPFFKHGPTPLARLLLCTLLSVALLISDTRYNYLGTMRQIVAVMLYPLQRLADAPAVLAGHLSEFIVTRSTLRTENERMAELHMQDAIILQNYRALQSENEHLRQLLDLRQHSSSGLTAAEIVYFGRDPFTQKVVIDKGARQQIKAGQPVIDQAGVVGQVTRVYPWLAEVTLITDKQHGVPVQSARNGLRAVIAGRGADGQLELKFIPLNADFQTGDQLVTSGIDGIYPPGLPVAVVTNVERNAAELFARITCKPLAGVANHVQVLVLNWENTAPPEPSQEEQSMPSKKTKKDK